MNKVEQILETEFTERLVDLMKDFMVTSYYKYGPVKKNYATGHIDPGKGDYSLNLFIKTRNGQYLINISNQ